MDVTDDAEKNECLKSLQGMLSVFTDLSKAQKLHWTTRREFSAAIKSILTLENLDFKTLADLFLKSIRDDDYRVRMFMAKAITVFFELFEDEEGILRDINKNLPYTTESK
jgi:hypothetical protein